MGSILRTLGGTSVLRVRSPNYDALIEVAPMRLAKSPVHRVRVVMPSAPVPTVRDAGSSLARATVRAVEDWSVTTTQAHPRSPRTQGVTVCHAPLASACSGSHRQ